MICRLGNSQILNSNKLNCDKPGNQQTTPSGPLPDPLSSNAIIGSQKLINYRFNHDYTFKPNLLNHVTYGVTKQRQYFDSPMLAKTGRKNKN